MIPHFDWTFAFFFFITVNRMDVKSIWYKQQACCCQRALLSVIVNLNYNLTRTTFLKGQFTQQFLPPPQYTKWFHVKNGSKLFPNVNGFTYIDEINQELWLNSAAPIDLVSQQFTVTTGCCFQWRSSDKPCVRSLLSTKQQTKHLAAVYQTSS